MGAVKSETVVGSPGAALMYDFLSAVEEQKAEVGIIEQIREGERRRQEFGRRWRGTTILARVTEDSPVIITKYGRSQAVDDGEGGVYYEPVRFKGAVGRVKSMGPTNGGFIDLTDNMEIDFPRSGSLSDAELGLEIEVLDLGPIEA